MYFTHYTRIHGRVAHQILYYPHLVEHFIEVAELGDLLHDLLLHEEGGVDRRVALAVEDPHGILDKSLLQEHRWTLE